MILFASVETAKACFPGTVGFVLSSSSWEREMDILSGAWWTTGPPFGPLATACPLSRLISVMPDQVPGQPNRSISFAFMVMLMRKDNNREFSSIVKCLKSIHFLSRDSFLNLLEHIKHHKMVPGFNHSVLTKCPRSILLVSSLNNWKQQGSVD